MLAKFTCAKHTAKVSDVNLLNSWVTIYLSWSWSVSFFSTSLIFVLQSVILTKFLTLGPLFSTVVRAVVVARLVILGILTLTPFILTLKVA